MPYKKSRARVEFESEAEVLLSLAREVSFKKIKLNYQHKKLIYQSAIVLLSSAIEEYLRVFIEDLFYKYNQEGATLSKIPENARTFALFIKQKNHYEKYFFQQDESKILNDLKISNQLFGMISENAPFNNQVTALTILNGKKYPSSKNLKALYNRIGIKDIFHTIRTVTDYKVVLESFLDIRETIVHQQSSNLTFDDIRRNFSHIRDLIMKLDKAAYRHVCRTSGQVFWP